MEGCRRAVDRAQGRASLKLSAIIFAREDARQARQWLDRDEPWKARDRAFALRLHEALGDAEQEIAAHGRHQDDIGCRDRRLFGELIPQRLIATPILAQLYFLYFVLPTFGITLSALVIGIGGLSFYYSGYLAEVFKAGLDAIPPGQAEAGKALGLTRVQTLLLILAPQTLRNIAAPLGNYFVSILKATPYLAVLAVPEMLGNAFDIASDSFRYAEPLLVVGIIFLALALGISRLLRRMEIRLMAPMKR